MERISENAIKVWRITSSINIIIYLLISLGCYLGLNKYTNLDNKLIAAISIFIVLLAGYQILKMLLVKVKFNNWFYSIDEKRITLNYGIIFKSTVLIPINRIQHVNTSQGPILKIYRLRELSINTAGGISTIPCVNEEDALDLQSAISNMVERSKQVHGL